MSHSTGVGHRVAALTHCPISRDSAVPTMNTQTQAVIQTHTPWRAASLPAKTATTMVARKTTTDTAMRDARFMTAG